VTPSTRLPYLSVEADVLQQPVVGGIQLHVLLELARRHVHGEVFRWREVAEARHFLTDVSHRAVHHRRPAACLQTRVCRRKHALSIVWRWYCIHLNIHTLYSFYRATSGGYIRFWLILRGVVPRRFIFHGHYFGVVVFISGCRES